MYTAKEAEHLSPPERQLLRVMDDSVLLLNISGPIGFAVARGLKQSVSDLDQNKTLLIDLTDARFVGTTSALAIKKIIVSYQSQGCDILLSSVCERVKEDFNKLKLLNKISPKHVFITRLEALNYLSKRTSL
ncbi:MAG: SulP family sulfate permease [Colwellia sp.]